MIRSFYDHLMRANSIHAVKKTLALAVEISFNPQGRKFIWDYAHAPSRRVPAAPVTPERQYFRRSASLVTRAKGAKRTALHLHAFTGKIRRPFSAVGGNNHPPAGDWILT